MPEHGSSNLGLLGSTQCGKSAFYWGKRTYVMGILNVSPDSFSGDGLSNVEAVVARAKRMVEEGADIIDVGGESTRPGSKALSIDEEMSRVIPVLEKLSQEISLPLSVDTYKLEVAQRALDAGANMINDIWGLKYEPGLAELAAKRKVPLVLMSNQRSSPTSCGRQAPALHQDILTAIINDLQRAIEQALDAGVPREDIIVDPGIGFGKTQEQNLEILRRMEELKILNRPILLGSSRKSVIGWMLELTPEQRLKKGRFVPCRGRRVEGTAATIAIGIAKGVDIVRVHDVKEMARVCKMSDAIIRGLQGGSMAAVYLCLGSNLGEREENLTQALTMLSQKVNLEKVSSIYETEPVGYKEQPFFLNLVCQISTNLIPEELLHLAKTIENKMGRVPSFPNSPRLIDIDILLYDDQVIKTKDLIIPHTGMTERAFVLIPLAEIAPGLVHPQVSKSIAEIAASVGGNSTVKKWHQEAANVSTICRGAF